MTNVLMIGAGAVGVTYGRHIQRSGAKLTFFVKPKYVEEVRQGILVYPLKRRERWSAPLELDDFDVVSTVDEVAAGRWDQVWLAISSPALRGGWLAPILDAAPDATVVMLQPGLLDRAFMLELVPEERLVAGLINLVAYHAPLPGQTLDVPGYAYWLPPLSSTPFQGERALQIMQTLKGGHMPASVRDDVTDRTVFGSAVLLPHMAALECAGWKLNMLRGDLMRLAARASQEATAVAAKVHGARPGLLNAVARPFFTCPISFLAPSVVPFDLEVYLRYHFEKVGSQTDAAIETAIEQGALHEVPTMALRALQSRLAAHRSGEKNDM